MKINYVLTIAASVFALGACGGGGSTVGDFVEACLSSSNLPRPICECAAKKASKELSRDGFAFLVASLKRDEAKTTALRSKLEVSEMMATGMFMARAPAQCAMEIGGN